jgi:hypothetical protein
MKNKSIRQYLSVGLGLGLRIGLGVVRLGTVRLLGLAGMLAAGIVPAQAAVRVYGEASSTGPEIQVQMFADLTGPAIVSYSLKLFYPSAQLELLSAAPNEAVWYFHDGARSLPYQPADTGTPGEVLLLGGRLDASQPLSGVTGNHTLLGTVRFRRSTPQTPSFDLTIGRPGQFASFVAVDGTVLEAQAGQVAIEGVKGDSADQDLDGLSDEWEKKFFGSTRGAFFSDDPDGDGVNNQGEQSMGSDPTDARSNLRLVLTGEKEKLLLEWPSAEDRVYTLEAAKELGRFEAVQEKIQATPPLNSLELDRLQFSEHLFFRLRVETRDPR